MNQSTTSPATVGLAQPLPAPTSPVSAPPTATAPAPVRPAPRVRYWEHMDPASRSLYPVD